MRVLMPVRCDILSRRLFSGFLCFAGLQAASDFTLARRATSSPCSRPMAQPSSVGMKRANDRRCTGRSSARSSGHSA